MRGGARIAVGTESGASVPSLRQQVDTYLAATGGVADPDTLYTVWGGGNDAFLRCYWRLLLVPVLPLH